MIQHKQSGKRYHRIDKEELAKLKSDAVQVNKTPLYIVDYDTGETYYLIDQLTFDLLNYYISVEGTIR